MELMAAPTLLFVLIILTFYNPCISSESSCSDDWLDCGNGNCVAYLWKCDGDNDCGNLKDEENCERTTETCLSSQFQCLTGHCIPHGWHCDGERDCEDGSDEQHCENDTHCHGFRCKDNHCIPSQWKCDGRKDCLDGSDEEFCPKAEMCSKTEFTCSSGTCLDRTRVCDSKKDCPDASDEGRHCSDFCNTTACSQNCRQTPKGPECYCNEGYTLGKDIKTCEDVNECLNEGFCSQQCTNLAGSYRCSCMEGYDLVNKTCQASAVSKAASVDVDPLESRVYWVEISNKSTVYSSKMDGTGFSVVLTNGLLVPEGIAVDYVARNLYFTDSGLKQILACKMDGSMCHILHRANIDKPRAIALDPLEGLVYWSDWGDNTSGIYRSGMDGSRRITLVSKDIKWPNGIAVDHTSNRLYWSDAKLLTIEYITLDGKTRKVLLHNEVFHPYSLAVFEDKLYWSDWTSFSLESSNKFTGHKPTVVVRENGKHIMGVHVYHPVLARRSNNPCWGSSCSHMCLIGPLNSHRCACPPGYKLGNNERTCLLDSDFPMLLVHDENTVYHILPEAAGSIAVSELPIRHVDLIGRLAYDWKSKTLFISDLKVPAIYSVNMMTFTRRELVKHHLAAPEGIAFDSESNNLYWVDFNKGTVGVMSPGSPKIATIITNLPKPMDIVLEPNIRRMFISTVGVQPSVRMYDMDGKNGKVMNAVTGLPMALAIRPSVGLLYWADPRTGTISSIDYLNSRSEPAVLKTGIRNVMSVAVSEKFLYWTDSRHHVLYLVSREEDFTHTISLPGIKSRLGSRKVIYAAPPISKRSLGNRDCANNGGCSYLCLSSPGGRSCACPDDMVLSTDKTSCKDKECTSDEFRCVNSEKCISRDFMCDGVKDCPDGSDEKCEGKVQECPNNDFNCSNGRCILASWRCDGRDDCGDNSDEVGCPPLTNCTKAQFSCNGGECVPRLWRCDGENDCKDNSDEIDCHATTCDDETQLRCGHGQCIPKSWVCDGAPDCKDNTDERNCSSHNRVCGSTEFRCTSGLCIDKTMVCDSRNDCEDGSDEKNCSQTHTCKEGRYACDDGITCIYHHEVCDGYKDCRHGEDERNCNRTSSQCTSEEYFCSNTSRCIARRWLCDGDNDCGDGIDELPENCLNSFIKPATPTRMGCEDYTCPLTGECISWDKVCDDEIDCEDLLDEGPFCSRSCVGEHGGCSQRCQKTPQGSKCFCYEGYALSKDTITCEDVNECDVPGSCSHFCNNTKGAFKCTCAEGYLLEYDHKKCKAAGEQAILIYLLPDEIRGIDLNLHSQHVYVQKDSGEMRGISYDALKGIVLWTDWGEKTINRLSLKDKKYDVLLTTLVRPHYLRWDWIARNIYYTDDFGDIICCNEDGKYCVTVIKDAAAHVHGFDISPLESFMFWSVWVLDSEGFGHLERAELDGSNRKVIVSNGTYWPSAVTVDNILKMVYWTDVKLSVVECSDFNGLKRRRIAAEDVQHPFSLTMFEDFIYWSDWSSDSLHRCDKFGRGNCTKLHSGNMKAEVMTIAHKATQHQGENRCANAKCPHVCLPTQTSFVCKCDDHFLSVESRCEVNPSTLTPESRVKQSCPDNYCFQDAECVVVRERYYCKCSSSFKGERCDVKMATTQDAYDYSWVVGVVLAILFVCLIVSLTFFCRKNREKLTKMGESVAVSFRNSGLSRKGSKLIEDSEEDATSDELDLGKKAPKRSGFGNPLFGKKSKTLADPESPDDFKRWHMQDSSDSAFENESQPRAGSGFRIGAPMRTTDRIVEFFKR